VRTIGAGRRTRLWLTPAALAVLAVLVTGCGGGEDPAAAPPVATSQVSVEDNVFTPVSAQVDPGTTVTWTWAGDNQHNVVGDGFSSELLREGTFTYTFDQPGEFPYRCTLHGGMRGVVVVGDAQ
jgi:plastocyanin